jgi:hypothetical protein
MEMLRLSEGLSRMAPYHCGVIRRSDRQQMTGPKVPSPRREPRAPTKMMTSTNEYERSGHRHGLRPRPIAIIVADHSPRNKDFVKLFTNGKWHLSR